MGGSIWDDTDIVHVLREIISAFIRQLLALFAQFGDGSE